MLIELKKCLNNRSKSNILFLVSGCSFSLLLLGITKGVLFCLLGIVVSLITSFFIRNFSFYTKNSNTFFKLLSFALLIITCSIIFRLVYTQSKIQANEKTQICLILLGTILTILSFYFIYYVYLILIWEFGETIKELLIYKSVKQTLYNIKKNILFIISAYSFLFLNIQTTFIGLISTLLAVIAVTVFFSQIIDIKSIICKASLGIKVYSIITTIGIVYFYITFFTEKIVNENRQLPASLNNILISASINPMVFLRIASCILPIMSSLVIYFLIISFAEFIFPELKSVFNSISKLELIVYFFIAISFTIFCCFAFTGSDAFWGTKMNYDVIYTSDSSTLVNGNAYLRLFHPENDLRQPLFAVFSAPFVGFVYALSIPFSFISNVFTPLFINIIQILMMIISNYIISKMMNLSPFERIGFMLFISATYTDLLFSVMMEQYIVAYFWLVFLLFHYVDKRELHDLIFTASSGTLLTSFVSLYLHLESLKEKSIRILFNKAKRNALLFLFFLISFSRIDVLLTFSSQTNNLISYAGGFSFFMRINQYTSFISSCFTVPNSVTDPIKYNHVSWQLSDNNIYCFNLFGFAILTVCIISFLLNKNDLFSRIAGIWILFSTILLCIVGWGSAENGMILYSLYFGWAFVVLVYKFIINIVNRFKGKNMSAILGIILALLVFISNFDGIADLIEFSFTNYPL